MAASGQGGGAVDRADAGVGVRGAQQAEVQQAFRRDIEGVAGGAAHDGLRGGGACVGGDLGT